MYTLFLYCYFDMYHVYIPKQKNIIDASYFITDAFSFPNVPLHRISTDTPMQRHRRRIFTITSTSFKSYMWLYIRHLRVWKKKIK